MSKLTTAATFLKSIPRDTPYSSSFRCFRFFVGCSEVSSPPFDLEVFLDSLASPSSAAASSPNTSLFSSEAIMMS